VSDVAARFVIQEKADDAEERQSNDGSEPRELEENGPAGSLCHEALCQK
jgi:hypothetical protein